MRQHTIRRRKRSLLLLAITLLVVWLGFGLTPPDSFSEEQGTDLELVGSFETLDRLGFSPDDVVYWPDNDHLFISSAGANMGGLYEVTLDGQLVGSYSFPQVPYLTGVLGFSVAKVTTGPRRGHFFLVEWNATTNVNVYEFDSNFNYVRYFPLIDTTPPGDSIAYNPFTNTLIVGHGGWVDFLEVSLDGEFIQRFQPTSHTDGLTFCSITGTYFGVHHMSLTLNEYTMNGTLVRTFDLSAFGVKNPVGIASARDLLFVADEGPEPTVQLGVIYIFRVPISGPLPVHFVLTISKSGTGNGTVTSSPTGINCGSDCSEPYDQGTSVTLTATSASDSIFAGWSGACSGTGKCSVTMDGDKTVTATFDKRPQYTLIVTKSGTGSGTLTSSPAGINCGGDCTEDFKVGTKITLKAKADTNSTFTGWSGGGCSGTGTCAVIMNADIAVTAAFSAKTPDISVASSSVDFGSLTVGKKITKTLKIANNGTGDLLVTLSGLEGTDFSIQGSSSVTIKAKKSYSLKVLCTPTSAGLKTATLEINSNDADTPTLEISLTGTLPATTPDISVAQTSLDFGGVKAGKKVTKTLKIGNNGTGDLMITLSGLEGTDFSIQGSSSVTIKGKKNYTLKVLFIPTSADLKKATLEITSNDPDTPTIDISLSGTGQ